MWHFSHKFCYDINYPAVKICCISLWVSLCMQNNFIIGCTINTVFTWTVKQISAHYDHLNQFRSMNFWTYKHVLHLMFHLSCVLWFRCRRSCEPFWTWCWCASRPSVHQRRSSCSTRSWSCPDRRPASFLWCGTTGTAEAPLEPRKRFPCDQNSRAAASRAAGVRFDPAPDPCGDTVESLNQQASFSLSSSHANYFRAIVSFTCTVLINSSIFVVMLSWWNGQYYIELESFCKIILIIMMRIIKKLSYCLYLIFLKMVI